MTISQNQIRHCDFFSKLDSTFLYFVSHISIFSCEFSPSFQYVVCFRMLYVLVCCMLLSNILLLPSHLFPIIPSLSYHLISFLSSHLSPTIPSLSYHPISLLSSHLFSNISSPSYHLISLLPSRLSPNISSLSYHPISLL